MVEHLNPDVSSSNGLNLVDHRLYALLALWENTRAQFGKGDKAKKFGNLRG
jgi:hypothetical protein